MSAPKDLTGMQFGRLTVVCEGPRHVTPSGYTIRTWRCNCQCGAQKDVDGKSLISGKTSSCGCLQRETTANRNYTHHQSKSRLYSIWKGMMGRCYNPKAAAYSNYGGRGIHVCDEWHGADGVIKFSEWAETHGYEDSLTLDRIDNDGDYRPDNCRWATISQQSNNKRNNHRITINDQTHTIAEWESITGLNRKTIKRRIYEYGFTGDSVFTHKLKEVFDERKTLRGEKDQQKG